MLRVQETYLWTKKFSKLNADEFFFDHTILSSRSELYFSPPSTENNQLKQFWLNKKDYSRFVKPILEILKNKAEYIMSEKSSFVIEKDKNIELVTDILATFLKSIKMEILKVN